MAFAFTILATALVSSDETNNPIKALTGPDRETGKAQSLFRRDVIVYFADD